MSFDVIFEDNHCLAINKPAGLLSQGDDTGEPSIVDLATAYLKDRYRKPGNVYVGLVHRLDRPTSGIVLLARTSKAAGRISEQFRAGSVRKVYRAIVEGRPVEREGEWVDILEKDPRTNRSALAGEASLSGKEARLKYRVVAHHHGRSELELYPATGRSHQLRVQLSTRGLSIVGDRKYGASDRLRALDGKARIALHAWRLTFTHPTKREPISLEAPVPADWPSFDK
jgi:23S rRNA pseudouridine1911/1915/1917 synthase